MAMCEDFPCCGHEMGCCPRFENGVQMDMVCTCGKRLPVTNRYSICDRCLRADDEDGDCYDGAFYDEDCYDGDEDDSDDGEDSFLDAEMEDRMSGGFE